MEERVKPIIGYEQEYLISDSGRVLRVLSKGKTKEIKLYKDKDGYLTVCLCKHNKKKTARVHRLVAEAFIPNNDRYPQVNHKDEIKSNNHYSNLEWCTAKYNTAYNDGTNRRAKKRKKPVVLFNDKETLYFDSASDAAVALNTSHGTISAIAGGYYGKKTINGYRVRFVTGSGGRKSETN